MEKYKNILSVDFDFFQNTDKNILKYAYPDGVDLSTELSCIVWADRYVKINNKIPFQDQVVFAQNLYDKLIQILSRQKSSIPVRITQSHVGMYDFVPELIQFEEEPFRIVNIDMHHDIFNDNKSSFVDCGNWVGRLQYEYPNMQYIWLGREVSFDLYGLDSLDASKETHALKQIIRLDFDIIKDMDFDAIFICRSDAWLAPHLDCHFDDLKNKCNNLFENVSIESDVSKPRDMKSIITDVQDAYDKFKAQMKG